ncbi:MAG: T9SS type A sorting domain-containing protein [Cruoricaptor ignavus]|nr:T9SS type A sorting domain-containing protein [Cruoricaptor ignavus]
MKTSTQMPKKVTIYDTKGNVVKIFLNTKIYDLQELETGLYLAEILDSKNKISRNLFQFQNDNPHQILGQKAS